MNQSLGGRSSATPCWQCSRRTQARGARPSRSEKRPRSLVGGRIFPRPSRRAYSAFFSNLIDQRASGMLAPNPVSRRQPSHHLRTAQFLLHQCHEGLHGLQNRAGPWVALSQGRHRHQYRTPHHRFSLLVLQGVVQDRSASFDVSRDPRLTITHEQSRHGIPPFRTPCSNEERRRRAARVPCKHDAAAAPRSDEWTRDRRPFAILPGR
jgi:hypothetical protein